LNQQVTKIFYNDVDSKTYILDSSAGIIAVYNAETMVRERDITLQQVPLTLCLSAQKDAFYLGYQSGKIYRLAIQTGEMTLLGDVLAEVTSMEPVNDKFLLVVTKAGYYLDSYVKVLDVTNSQVVDAASDDSLEKLYLLSTTDQKKMLVLRQDNFFVDTTVDLLGTPKRIYHTPTNIVIFTQNGSAEYYVKVLAKADLGLI
jgi:hypothetical protein